MKISKLYPDFNNFTILYNLYDNWEEIEINTTLLIAPIKRNLLSFNSTFKTLYTADGYKGFINDVENVSRILLDINDYVSL